MENNQTFSGVFNGANDFTKVGSGTLTLSGNNSTASYTGKLVIDAGTISVAADTNLGAAPGSAVADQLTLSGGTLQTTADFTLNTNRGITLSTDGGGINTDASTTLTYGGVITGSTAFTKSGDGILALSGTNTYTGTTTISGGQLNILSEAGIGTAPGSFVANQLIFNGGTLFNYNGASITFDANRGVTITGNGTFKVNNS